MNSSNISMPQQIIMFSLLAISFIVMFFIYFYFKEPFKTNEFKFTLVNQPVPYVLTKACADRDVSICASGIIAGSVQEKIKEFSLKNNYDVKFDKNGNTWLFLVKQESKDFIINNPKTDLIKIRAKIDNIIIERLKYYIALQKRIVADLIIENKRMRQDVSPYYQTIYSKQVDFILINNKILKRQLDNQFLSASYKSITRNNKIGMTMAKSVQLGSFSTFLMIFLFMFITYLNNNYFKINMKKH